MAKQIVRTMIKAEIIWTKIINKNYGVETKIKSLTRRPGCSLVWRVVCSGKEVIEQGLYLSLGDGKRLEYIVIHGVSNLPLDNEVGHLLAQIEGKS